MLLEMKNVVKQFGGLTAVSNICLLYTSDAADELRGV